MSNTPIYHDFNAIKELALYYAKLHNRNYNVIIVNPDENGNFNEAYGSTYEFVNDNYFSKERPNVVKVYQTNETLHPELVKNKEDEKIKK